MSEDTDEWITFKDEIVISKPHLKKETKKKNKKNSPPLPKGSGGESKISKQLVTQKPEEIIKQYLANIPPQQLSQQQKDMVEQIVNLAMQLGSSKKHLGQGEIDERKFANLSELEQIALGHFMYRGEIDNIRYFKYFVDWQLPSSVSIGGLGRRQTIQTIGATKGQAIPDFVRKPNWLARRTYKRDWEKEAEEKGQVVVE